MLTEILMESLMTMDEDVLDSVLESCSDEEIDIINVILEAVSEKDKAILSRGYKVGDGMHPIKDMQEGGIELTNTSFFEHRPAKYKFFTKNNLKNIAGDLKVDAVRIKNNLKGDGNEVSDILDKAKKRQINEEFKNNKSKINREQSEELSKQYDDRKYLKKRTNDITNQLKDVAAKYHKAKHEGTAKHNFGQYDAKYFANDMNKKIKNFEIEKDYANIKHKTSMAKKDEAEAKFAKKLKENENQRKNNLKEYNDNLKVNDIAISRAVGDGLKSASVSIGNAINRAKATASGKVGVIANAVKTLRNKKDSGVVNGAKTD